jgi:hypothetical protein
MRCFPYRLTLFFALLALLVPAMARAQETVIKQPFTDVSSATPTCPNGQTLQVTNSVNGFVIFRLDSSGNLDGAIRFHQTVTTTISNTAGVTLSGT